jgi:hypothetical protein
MTAFPDYYKQVRARMECATPGPWHVMRDGSSIIGSMPETPHYPTPIATTAVETVTGEYARRATDALFIAEARRDVPLLLDRAEHLEAENRALREIAEAVANGTATVILHPDENAFVCCSCGRESEEMLDEETLGGISAFDYATQHIFHTRHCIVTKARAFMQEPLPRE